MYTRFLLDQNFVWQKLFLRRTFYSNYLMDQTIFDWIFFLTRILFWPTCFVPIFLDKLFCTNFHHNNFWINNFLCTIIFLKTFFWHQYFLDKSFLPKWRWPQRGTKNQPKLDKSKFSLSLAQLSPSFLDLDLDIFQNQNVLEIIQTITYYTIIIILYAYQPWHCFNKD